MTSINDGDNDNGDNDGQREKKRQRRLLSSRSSSEEEKGKDPIIGLDVCGKVYYCHQSTLIRNSQYFATRFEGRFNADVAYQDQVTGRDVYFVERCPSLFKHIFAYMISPLDFQLPSFDENPTLWRKLRNEADYFGIDGLCNILNVTHSVSPTSNYNRGLLYWLGCRRGTSKYENPHEIGVLHVGGWVDVGSKELIRGIHNPRRSGTEYCRKRIVQHRLNLNDMSRTTELTNRDEGDMFYPSLLMFCSHAVERLPVTIDLLESVQIRPTHYSLRSFACYGMAGDWDFDGSCDGTTWDTLHAARDDMNLNLSEREFQDEIRDSLQTSIILPSNDDEKSNNRKADALTSCIEKDYRHTWKLDPEPSKFYRYFRIIGATRDRGGRFFQQCLHGEGLELFGDLRDE